MKLSVISDLHIKGREDPLYGSLLALLEQSSSGDIVVLAGDVFDLLVGNKVIFLTQYAEFFSSLRSACSRGVSFHYIEGNHDFLMESVFKGYSGFHLHPHETTFEIGGKRFFVAHGDTVDPEDYGYRFLRAFLRSLPIRVLIFLIPGSWLAAIGKASSDASGKRQPRLPSDLPQGGMERLRRVYRNFAAERLAQGFDYVILGHCHDLDEMTFNLGDRPGQYVNVGYPRKHGSYLTWIPGDEKVHREKLPSNARPTFGPG